MDEDDFTENTGGKQMNDQPQRGGKKKNKKGKNNMYGDGDEEE